MTAPRKLHPGDTLEYSVTAEVKEGGRSLWVKVGGSTTIQEGELTNTAFKRLSDFVEQKLDKKVNEIVS